MQDDTQIEESYCPIRAVWRDANMRGEIFSHMTGVQWHDMSIEHIYRHRLHRDLRETIELRGYSPIRPSRLLAGPNWRQVVHFCPPHIPMALDAVKGGLEVFKWYDEWTCKRCDYDVALVTAARRRDIALIRWMGDKHDWLNFDNDYIVRAFFAAGTMDDLEWLKAKHMISYVPISEVAEADNVEIVKAFIGTSINIWMFPALFDRGAVRCIDYIVGAGVPLPLNLIPRRADMMRKYREMLGPAALPMDTDKVLKVLRASQDIVGVLEAAEVPLTPHVVDEVLNMMQLHHAKTGQLQRLVDLGVSLRGHFISVPIEGGSTMPLSDLQAARAFVELGLQEGGALRNVIRLLDLGVGWARAVIERHGLLGGFQPNHPTSAERWGILCTLRFIDLPTAADLEWLNSIEGIEYPVMFRVDMSDRDLDGVPRSPFVLTDDHLSTLLAIERTSGRNYIFCGGGMNLITAKDSWFELIKSYMWMPAKCIWILNHVNDGRPFSFGRVFQVAYGLGAQEILLWLAAHDKISKTNSTLLISIPDNDIIVAWYYKHYYTGHIADLIGACVSYRRFDLAHYFASVM